MENICVKYTMKVCSKFPFKQPGDQILSSVSGCELMILQIKLPWCFQEYLFGEVCAFY